MRSVVHVPCPPKYVHRRDLIAFTALAPYIFVTMSVETQRSTAASQAAFARALQLMPGGVSSPVRAFKGVGGTPLFIKEADGCIVTDLDNNKYIDYVGSYGPMIVGHAHERVVAALSKAIGRGTSYGAPTEQESQLASIIVSAMPSVGDAAICQFRHRSGHERHPPRPRRRRAGR